MTPRKHTGVTVAKFGALGLGAVALGCAALAAYFIGNLLTAKGFTGDRVRPVVVAKHDLAAAQPLAAADLEIVSWPEAHTPPGAFETIDEVFAADARPVPAVGILAGEPVVASRLSSVDTGSGIARLVRPNMRAVALQVDDSVGYTGLVYPGAFVDVIVTVRDPEGRGPSSRIGVQNARVLTVGADTDVATRRAERRTADRLTQTPDQGGTYVTLEVTPEEAEILSIASNEGKLDLALRNGADQREVDTAGATFGTFSAFSRRSDGDAPPLAQAPAAPEPSSRARRKRSIQLVASDEPDQPTESKKTAPARIETIYAN